MNMLKCLLACALFQSFAANAATINTALFSIEVPDQWHIEDNKSGIVLALGRDLVGSHPSPILWMQYCAVGDNAKPAGVIPCDKPCSEKPLIELMGEGAKESLRAPVRRERPNGVTEWSIVAVSSESEFGQIALLCHASAQVFLSFTSAGPSKEAASLLARMLDSLKWK